jgi:translation initiation factor IF-2
MTKGLRGALFAPLVAALLVLGAPAATYAAASHPGDPGASKQQDPPRGAHSAHPDPDQKGDQGSKPGPDNAAKPGPNDNKDPKAGDQPKDPNAGPQPKDPKAGNDKPGGDKPGGDKPGGDKPGGDKPGGDKPGGDKPGGDKPGNNAGHDAHNGWYGHYDHDHYGYHGHHNWDTHRRYYRYGYAGPGWYDDCGYYGPNGYDGYYDSPDACDYQYGPQGQSLRANMSGDQEVPGPGAPNAFGTANIFVDVPNGRLCYRLSYDGINQPSMAHIHRGGPGQAGPPVIDLRLDANGDEGCVPGDPTVLHNIADHPEAFYLNLHTPDYPDGAMRGQLFGTDRY